MTQDRPSTGGNGYLRPAREGASRTGESPRMISSAGDSDNATISPAVAGSSDHRLAQNWQSARTSWRLSLGLYVSRV